MAEAEAANVIVAKCAKVAEATKGALLPLAWLAEAANIDDAINVVNVAEAVDAAKDEGFIINIIL